MIKLTCKCTSCGVDQSKAWGDELGKWYSGALADVEARREWFDREAERLDRREKALKAREQAAKKPSKQQTEIERMRKHAEQAEARARKAESKLASIKKVARREIFRQISTGRLDPYEFLLVEGQSREADCCDEGNQ